MKRLILAAAFGAMAIAMPALSADAPAKPTAVKTAASANRMDPGKGTFHSKHTQKLKLACDTCHDAKAVDVLVVSRASGAASPGPVNREACRTCHQSPGKPTWYGAAK